MNHDHDTNAPQTGAGGGQPVTQSDAVKAYQSMAKQFDDLDGGNIAEETSVELPLENVLNLLPHHYVTENRGDLSNKTVSLGIADLHDQLRKGKVSMSVRDIASYVPASLVQSEAFDDPTIVNLPLAAVVAAIDPAELKTGDKRKVRKYDITNISDPFKKIEGVPLEAPAEAPAQAETPPAPEKPAAAATADKAVTETERPVEAEPETAALTKEAEPEEIEHIIEPARPESIEMEPPVVKTLPTPVKPIPPPVPDQAPSPVEEEASVFEPLYGVNLNTADSQQLMSIGGISVSVASRIIKYRDSHGPFDNIFALCNVPGLGRKTFRKLTGMSYSRTKRHRAGRLVRLLGIPWLKVAHLPTVAEGLSHIKGIFGCVFSDQDGLVIAECHAGDFAEAVAAVAREIMEQMRRNMDLIEVPAPTSVSISIKDQLLTVVQSGDIYMTVIHDSHRITGAQLNMIQTVARELAWAFSRIVFVGG